MRTPIYVLIAALFFSGCTHYHVTPAGTPAASPDRIAVPEPEPLEPLELDIGRPSGGQLLLQTNRPAYVAIFEIVPNRGVTLIYPAAAHQQNMLVSGLTWVPLWWSPRRVSSTSDRYIYAVASEEPLRLSGETFQVGYFHRVLGVPVYRAENPYSTMRAISRTVVPNVAEEEWAEDLHIVTPAYLTETYRTARIHCPGGRVFEVPEEMVTRIWCPTRTRVVIVDAGRPRARGDYPVGRPARPDSVFGPGGGRVKIEPRRRRGPVIRVVDPTGRDRDERDVRRGRDNRDDRRSEPRRVDRDEDSERPDTPKRGRIADLIREKQEKEREKREREEARRQEAEERRNERDARKDERDRQKEERRDEREERKEERDERKEGRQEEREERREEPKREEPNHEEPKQQGETREAKQEKREDKQEKQEKQEKRDEPRRSVRELIKEKKEKP